MNEKFQIPGGAKITSIILMAVGLVSLLAGIIVFHNDMPHVWANLLLDSTFYLGITIGTLFFICANYVAWGGWNVVLKRVPEAIIGNLPLAAVIFLLIFIFGHSTLYPWTNSDEVAANPVLQGKQGFLNIPFFLVRFAGFVGLFVFIGYTLRKASLLEDQNPDVKYYRTGTKWSSIFLVFYAVYICTSSWDYLMSTDPEWYSTMFGWQNFAGYWVSALAAITLVIIYLKSKGYLSEVTKEHLHVMGILMFAFSIFWTYVTFDQFMLIWYANLPEETIYFRQRYDHYSFLFGSIWILNFLAPFLILMRNTEKEKPRIMAIACIIILSGHFIDFFLMVFPSVMKNTGSIGWLEIGMPCLFIGLFIYTTMMQLTKAATVPKNHPFLNESLHFRA